MTVTQELPYEDVFFMIQQKKMELEATIRDYGEAAMKSLVKGFLTKHPYVTVLRWKQYTPYFNDGDPCIFGVHDPEVLVTPELCEVYNKHHGESWHACEEEDDDGELCSTWSLNDSSLKDDLMEFGNKTGSNPDLLHAVFGDHVQITCNANDIIVEEYEHD